jgi:cellulose synthase/poly-beta-1,6-N-acetylglucosamine synthase-like glycosyltransferase
MSSATALQYLAPRGWISAFFVVVTAGVGLVSIRRALFLVAAVLRPRRLPAVAGLPVVTVLVPAWNERAVASRLLNALARLEYPADQISFVFVCDGCSDGSPLVFRSWAEQHSNAQVLELARHGGKAAALNAGLRLATGEIIVVIDADVEPLPTFLLQLTRPFADERVGAAAGFLRPRNADDNVVARYAAITSWVPQLMTSAGTDRLGLNPPTFGAAAYRRTALQSIDGFPLVPVGEDVATSTRIIRRGWRTRFVATAVADNTVVSNLRDYWKQHIRDSRGVWGSSRDELPPLDNSWLQRLETVAATIGYGDRLVFAAAVGGAIVGALPVWVPVLYLAVPGLEIMAALVRGGVGRRMPQFLFAGIALFAVDLGASVAAALAHLTRRPYRWHQPRWLPDSGETGR